MIFLVRSFLYIEFHIVQMKEDFFDTKFPVARLAGKSRVFKLLRIYIFHKSHHLVFHHVQGLNISHKKLFMGISLYAEKFYKVQNYKYVIYFDIVLYIWITMNINIYSTYTSEVFKKMKSWTRDLLNLSLLLNNAPIDARLNNAPITHKGINP